MIDGNDESEAVTVTAETKTAIFDALVEITHQLSKQDDAKAQIKTIATTAQDSYMASRQSTSIRWLK